MSGLLPSASRRWDPGLAVARNKSGLECVSKDMGFSLNQCLPLKGFFE